jgi:hypothetical protein
LNLILKEKKELERMIDFFSDKKVLFKKRSDNFEIEGHIQKSKHNLKFVKDNLN